MFSFPSEEIAARQAAYERALGKLTVNFSFLHVVLEMFGWKLWKLEQLVGSVLTRDLPVKPLVEKLRESTPGAIWKEDDRKQFLAILKKVEDAADQRNHLLHSLWFFQGPKPVSCFSRKGLKESTPALEEIDEFNKSLLGIIFELAEFEKKEPLKTPLLLALEEFAAREKPKT